MRESGGVEPLPRLDVVCWFGGLVLRCAYECFVDKLDQSIGDVLSGGAPKGLSLKWVASAAGKM